MKKINDKRDEHVIKLLDEIAEGRMSKTLALGLAFNAGKEIPETRLRELLQAAQSFVQTDSDNSLFELECAIHNAREYLVNGETETQEEKYMKFTQEEFEKIKNLAKKLFDLQKQENNGRGVSSVRTLIHYLEINDINSARAVYENEGDKISSYPEIEKLICENLNIKPRYGWKKNG